MPATGVRVEGAAELRRDLRKLRVEGLGRQLAPINKSAADVVVAAALPNVPVRSGRLKRSVRALGSQRAGRARAGSASVDYAAAIHWGRKRGNVWGNKPGNNPIVGRPFLWDAAQRQQQAVVAKYQSSINALIERTVRGR